MGRIKKGILGGFSGKVGTVVGANWKSICYMRSLPQKVKNPRTEAQQKQRAKLKFAIDYLKPLHEAIQIGWKNAVVGKQSPFNAAVSHMMKNAITGTYPNYEIDHSKLLISKGSLLPPAEAFVAFKSPINPKSFNWDSITNGSTANPKDIALVAVYNSDKKEVIVAFGRRILYGDPRRETGRSSIRYPENWANDSIHAYLGFISEDGKQASNSKNFTDPYIY